jgi:hypothetical protein
MGYRGRGIGFPVTGLRIGIEYLECKMHAVR